MGRTKFSSPTLQLRITEEMHDEAVRSQSGGCLLADAIKKQYPQFSRVQVDMATIRVSDLKRGQRYVYLTPPAAQNVLLHFDQGWPQKAEDVTVRSAVKILPIVRSEKEAQKSAARRVELEEKVASGEGLTQGEKAALGRLRKSPVRPTKRGKSEVKVNQRANQHGGAVVRGGTPLRLGTKTPNPNLLRGRDRHFGAKIADPGLAFKEAVEAAVAERMAEAGVDAIGDQA